MKKKENIIIVLLIIILIWLAILSYAMFIQDKNIKLHEYWIRTALDMAK